MKWKSAYWILIVSILMAFILIPEHALAKRVSTGHPSLFVTLYAGTDPRFDFVVVEDAKTVEELKVNIDQKLYGIFDMIVLPEIRREFAERAGIYSDNYVESISVYLDMNESTLDILIEKVPGEYGCSEEGCAHRRVSVNVPAELRLSHFDDVGFSVAVYEQMDSGGTYDQFVERITMKALTEARFLFSEGANVLEANREVLLENGTTIEHILLRQYEDISRINVLFLPSEIGVASTAKKPIDVVVTSNSYYQRFWSSSSDPQSQEAPSEEVLQECEERGMEIEDCSETAILQSIPRQPALNKEANAQQNNAIESSYLLIGIGAAAAGITAIVAIKKLK